MKKVLQFTLMIGFCLMGVLEYFTNGPTIICWGCLILCNIWMATFYKGDF